MFSTDLDRLILVTARVCITNRNSRDHRATPDSRLRARWGKNGRMRFVPGSATIGRRICGLRAGVLLLTAGILLAACQPTRESPPPTAEEPAAPRAAPLPSGYSRLEVDTGASLLQVFVYRDGPMARLGHNHVVSTTALSGEVVLDRDGGLSRLQLVLPVASLEVDRPELRAAAGPDFPGEVPVADREGTRQNLLGEAFLDAARYPEIRLASGLAPASGVEGAVRLAVEATVRGGSYSLEVPVTVTRDGDQLEATGEISLSHGELGLKPFSVMGGLLSVRDELRLSFRIVAAPAAD